MSTPTETVITWLDAFEVFCANCWLFYCFFTDAPGKSGIFELTRKEGKAESFCGK
jgi:hypothetical protein